MGMDCRLGMDGYLLSTCLRTLIVRAVVPAVLVISVAALDILFFLGIFRAKPVREAIDALCRPFSQFLHYEDLAEFDASKSTRIVQPKWKFAALGALCVVHITAWTYDAAYAAGWNSDNQKGFWTALVVTLCWTYMFLRITVFYRPSTPPYPFMLFVTISAIATFFDLLDGIMSSSKISTGSLVILTFRLVDCIALLAICTTLPINDILPSPWVASVGSKPSSNLSSPEDSVNLWNWLTFNFMEPLFRVADQGTLEDEDIWDLPPTFKHANLFRKLLKTQSVKPQSSLLWFLLSSNSLDLSIDLVLKTWTSVVGFVPPYCLSRILSALESHDPNRRPEAYLFAFLAFIAHMSFAQSDLLQGWHSRRTYERTRGQLFCALHWKALKGKDAAGKIKGQQEKDGDRQTPSKKNEESDGIADIGRITNLMSGDAYAVAQRFWEFSSVFTAPIKLAIALTFLYQILGWSCFAGVGVVLLAYLATYPLGNLSISITRSSWAAKDNRMSLVNELFQSIRFLKYMGWESHWTDKVKDSRKTELEWRVKENIVSAIIAFIWTWIPSAVVLAAFSTYTLIAGMPLSVSKAFVAVEIFSQLQGPMSDLPNQIFALLHAYVSMQRIEKFLSEDEVEDWACSLKRPDIVGVGSSRLTEARIGFEQATFEWHAKSISTNQDKIDDHTPDAPDSNDEPILSVPYRRPFALHDLTVDFPAGKLSLVTGRTGSGKSSLLAALLGEMDRISGSVFCPKSEHQLALAGQFPFLEHATIKDNIVYHSPFDKVRYANVLEACSLVPDLAILDAGDMTEIGEKGVSLSGGQRARVALARAIYSRSQCVLLDDPLAAVDMHTAKHLYHHCLTSDSLLMRGRTIILVTHHVSLCLPGTSYIVELADGRVVLQGSVEDLRRRGLLASVIEAEDVAEDDHPKESVVPIAHNDADATGGPAQAEEPIAPSEPNFGKLVDEEARAEGRVSVETYMVYIRAAGWFSWLLTLFLLLFIRGITVANQLYIGKWAEAYNPPTAKSFLRLMTPQGVDAVSLPPPQDNVTPWLLIYLSISLAGAFSVLAYICVGYWAGLQASRSLFIAMLDRVSRAPTRLFDKTPIGRILNRFVADIGAVDNALNSSARNALSGTLTFFISFGVIVFVVPKFAPFAIAIAFLYIRIAPSFVRAARDLRRLESISLSPAFAGFDELLHGLVHIRAYAMEHVYQNRFYLRVDNFQKQDHHYWNAQMRLKWQYDVLGSVVVFLTTAFALFSGVREALAAVVIIQAGVFAEASRTLVKVLAQAELDFNSIERIKEYLLLDQEAALTVPHPPPAYWPSSTGGIDVDKLVIQYAPGLPQVLKGISFKIKPREKIGVVGRTGSGKSTLALSLLRIIEPTEGNIYLDGIDIATVGLEDLRKSITIVSQDVALFSGTVRSNLDPFTQYSDSECWDVLDRCHLSAVDPENRGSRTGTVIDLDMAVSAGGSSFSAGQRQLLALARAMLRRSSFVILDEASSSIDLATDDQIQETIRVELADSLVLTIAHRLKTVLDYDRILVLGSGEILEFDTPAALFQKKGGAFREMCQRSADWEELRRIIGRQTI